MASLEETCDRLKSYFAGLKASRAHKNHGPVYALEHPLLPAQVDELTKQLRNICRQSGLLREHWLAWIVLATECGYSYSGTQYWPKLHTRIPNWTFSYREVLRVWFERFAKEYSGARPSGYWARHFSVIAWPITHAILPRDLQVYLSQAIYVARYYLVDSETRLSSDIGRLVSTHSFTHGDRFTRFMQQHEFVGTLVKLLLHVSDDTDTFSEPTIRRIVSDLETQAEARYWLKEARNHCRPKIRSPQPASGGRAVPIAAASLSLSPDLIFREESNGDWRLFLQPASLIALLQRRPEFGKDLPAMRFSVVGATSQLYQARDLNSPHPRARELHRFPPMGKPLLICEPADTGLARLIKEESVLTPRNICVLRIRRDRSAWLQASPNVSPGSSYLLAITSTAGNRLPGMPQNSQCEGAILSRLDVPLGITGTEVAGFAEYGLGVQTRATVRPWGLLPRRWNEGESAEYLEGEAILLRVERDHAFDVVRCRIDTEAALEHDCSSPGDFLLELTGLKSGEHLLAVDTCTASRFGSTKTLETLASLTLQLRVRPPSTWNPDRISHEAISIQIQPDVPAIDDLLAGNSRVAVQGRASSCVHVELVLADDAGNESRHSIVRRKPPLLEGEWQTRLKTALRTQDIALNALGASRGHLSFSCERFGVHRADVAILPKPLRWSAHLSGSDYEVRFRCDDAQEATIVSYSFDSPLISAPVSFDDCERGLVHANGLYVASLGMDFASIVVSNPPKEIHGLAALRDAVGTPSISGATPDALTRAYKLWRQADGIGRAVDTRREVVLSALHDQLVASTTGKRWTQLERQLPDASAWNMLEDNVGVPTHRNYGITLGKRRTIRDLATLRLAFESASRDYGISTSSCLVDTAWHLVFDPGSLADDWTPPSGDEAIALGQLTRGARLLKLGIESQGDA